MTDCLIIGVNDQKFEDYVETVKSMGTDSGAFQDINLAFIEHEGRIFRALDMVSYLNKLDGSSGKKPLHNLDFLWPTIAYLGSYIHKRGYTFDYVNLFQQEKEKLKDKLLNGDVLTVAITTTLYVSIEPIKEIVSFIRKYNKNVKILIGGPFVYNNTRANNEKAVQFLFNYIEGDIYVIGSEGEHALVNIIEALKNGSGLENIPNIAFKNGKQFFITDEAKEENSIEELVIDYSLFPKEDIGEFVTLRTAKSCPFRCAYCSFPVRSNKYEYLSPKMVEEQLDNIAKLDTITTISFSDDTFNLPKDRFKEILNMMIEKEYNFKWNSYYRCDHGDEEIIELMKKAGCEGVFLGVESGSDIMLKRMNKTARRKDYLKYIPLLREAGILVHANFIVGFPGERGETVQESISLIEEAQPDFYRAQLWYGDPITPIYKKKEEYGIKGNSFNWSHNTMDSKTGVEFVEKMFMTIENSVWLPQFGFELWSTFYLQRRGMSITQIKTFIKQFNLLIKNKIINKNSKSNNPVIFERMRNSCQLNTDKNKIINIDSVRNNPVITASSRDSIEHYGNIKESIL